MGIGLLAEQQIVQKKRSSRSANGTFSAIKRKTDIFKQISWCAVDKSGVQVLKPDLEVETQN